MGVGAHSLRAAGRVNTTANVKITAAVASSDTSIFAQDYKGEVVVKLYKLASLNEAGTLIPQTGYESLDLDALPKEITDTSVQDIKTNIVEPAMELIGDEADATITFNKNDESSGFANISSGAGLYLYVPQDAEDNKYRYEFTPYIIFAPTSEYITTGQGSDQWTYDVSFNLKSSEIPLTGKLKIVKTLDSINVSLGDVSCVYKVKAVVDEKTVLDNVYTIDFTAEEFAESNTAERILPEDIPATAVVTITEEYPGASYKLVDTDEKTKTRTIVAGETVDVDYENTYNDKLIIGGIAAENHFVEDENGEISWVAPEEEAPVVEIAR